MYFFPASLFFTALVGYVVLIVGSFIITTFSAALAHGGASPFPTPAGLWPGGYIPVELLSMQWWWRVVSGGGGGAAGFQWW
jgi:hypothetical protein